LADLVALMAQYGPDVIRASLSAREQRDLSVESQLDMAASNPAASADAKLVAAAYFWNRHVVLRVFGDPAWRRAHRRAVSLVRQSAALDPGLRESSAFVRLVLAAADETGAEPGAAEVPSPEATAEQRWGPRPGLYVGVDAAAAYLGGTAPDLDSLSVDGYLVRARIAAGGFVSRRVRLGGFAAYAWLNQNLRCDSDRLDYELCVTRVESRALPVGSALLDVGFEVGIRASRLVTVVPLAGYTQIMADLGSIGDPAGTGFMLGFETELSPLHIEKRWHLGVVLFLGLDYLMHETTMDLFQGGVGLRGSYY
jgi:hypothetical protein